jgi:hypothetical protein
VISCFHEETLKKIAATKETDVTEVTDSTDLFDFDLMDETSESETFEPDEIVQTVLNVETCEQAKI